MGIKGFISAQAGMRFSEYISIFTRILAIAPWDATNTQKNLHEKISNDYRLYLKKMLNNPASIDNSFRRTLLARLNKLHDEDFYSERLLDARLARMIINDIENNGDLLLAEFPTLEDKSDFITKIEEERILPHSLDNFIPFPVKTGQLKEKINKTNHYNPIRARISEYIDLGTESFMNQEWRSAVRYFNLAITLLNTTLSTEKDYTKIHTDLTCRVAACFFSEGIKEIENKKLHLAMLKFEEAYDVILTIHPAAINSKIKKLINDYHYMNLKSINLYAASNLKDIKFLQSNAIRIYAEKGELLPLELELIRLLVKATYLQIKTSLATREFASVIHDLNFALLKNDEALSIHHYPEEKTAQRMLGRFTIVIYALAAKKMLSSDRARALELYCNALTTSFYAYSFDLDLHHKIIDVILNTFNSQELETINQILEAYYEEYPEIADAFHALKFSFRLNYKRAFLASKEDTPEKTLDLLRKADSYFLKFEAAYFFSDNEKKALTILKASLYYGMALIHFKVGADALETNLAGAIANFHRSFEYFLLIPESQISPECEFEISEVKIAMRYTLEEYLNVVMFDINFDQHITFIKQLRSLNANFIFQDMYSSALLNVFIKKADQTQKNYKYNDASNYYIEAEAAWTGLSIYAVQKVGKVISQIRCYQAENFLLQHNSLQGYKSEKLNLLVRAFDIYMTVEHQYLEQRNLAQIDYITTLINNFHTQTVSRMDNLLNLQINMPRNQTNHTFFTPSKKEFTETIKPLLFSLREDKSSSHLEVVKTTVIGYLNKYQDNYTILLKRALKLIDNYLLSQQRLNPISRLELQTSSLPRP